MFRRPVNNETTPRPPVHRKLAAVGYSDSVDIWSFGILCLELAFGKPPDYDLSPAAVIYNRLQLPAPGPENYEEGPLLSKTFLDLVSRCLHKDPDRRPSAKQLLKHRYFKKARDAAYLREHLLDHLPPAYLGTFSLRSRFTFLPSLPSGVSMCDYANFAGNQFTGEEADTPSVDITIVKNQRGSVMTRGTRGSDLGIGSTMMQPMQVLVLPRVLTTFVHAREALTLARRRAKRRARSWSPSPISMSGWMSPHAGSRGCVCVRVCVYVCVFVNVCVCVSLLTILVLF
jgi:serine/threonine protein kinase